MSLRARTNHTRLQKSALKAEAPHKCAWLHTHTRTPRLRPSPSLHAHTRAHAHPPVLIWNIVGGAGPVEGSEIAPGATLPFERPKFPFLRSAAWGWKCRAASLQSPRGTATATLTALHRDHGLARLTRWSSAHIALAHRRHTKTPQASHRPSECAPRAPPCRRMHVTERTLVRVHKSVERSWLCLCLCAFWVWALV